MPLIRAIIHLFKRQPYEDCCPHHCGHTKMQHIALAKLKRDPWAPFTGEEQ